MPDFSSSRLFIVVAALSLLFWMNLGAKEARKSDQRPRGVVPGATCGSPPSDAIVLFDGEGTDAFHSGGKKANWTVEGGILYVGKGSLTTKKAFGDIQLHMEWLSPTGAKAKKGSQDRGNSGIKFHEAYEIQVLDSYGAYQGSIKGQAGSVYAQTPPMVNACTPPGNWQVYDIIFRAPYLDGDGKIIQHGTFTVFHNGVLVQDNTKILGRTNSNKPVKSDYKMPFFLQDHGARVGYRNIWVRELDRRPLEK